jgi:hypothetical protein
MHSAHAKEQLLSKVRCCDAPIEEADVTTRRRRPHLLWESSVKRLSSTSRWYLSSMTAKPTVTICRRISSNVSLSRNLHRIFS